LIKLYFWHELQLSNSCHFQLINQLLVRL